MSKPVVQARIATYRDLIGIGEGLSFSDYYDDSIPYEVKPPQSITPMEEMDFPTQAKDLFKQIRETDSLLGHQYTGFWLDLEGRFFGTHSHSKWVGEYLKKIGVPISDKEDPYDIMYRKGWFRVQKNTENRTIYFQLGGRGSKVVGGQPNHKQMKELKDAAIELNYRLVDDVKNSEIDLMESLLLEDTLKKGADYWMGPDGKFNYTREGHAYWGLKYCLQNHIEFDEQYDSSIYEALYKRNFLRIKVTDELYVDYDREWPPSNLQWRRLKDSAIENHLKLIDSGNGQRREIDLLESVIEGSSIFIGRMKPEQKEEFKSALAQLFSRLREELKLKSVPKVHLLEDETNSKKLLGRTGYYDPATQKICLYMTNRHPKDILRSFAHEVIHHWQHENKQLDKSEKKESANTDPQYAQNDPWMRQMEKQAYLLGNMLFRDWEDGKKAKDRKSSKKLAEKTLPIGRGYPPKKPNYRG